MSVIFVTTGICPTGGKVNFFVFKQQKIKLKYVDNKLRIWCAKVRFGWSSVYIEIVQICIFCLKLDFDTLSVQLWFVSLYLTNFVGLVL